MRHLKWLIIFIGFFCQVSLAGMSQPIYSEAQTVISVSSQQSQFVIQLPSNPSTGYSWFLMNYDRHLLVPVKHYYQKAATHLVGASGVEMWIFQAKPDAFKVSQQTSIRFIYARPWEAKIPVKTINFTVSLQKT